MPNVCQKCKFWTCLSVSPPHQKVYPPLPEPFIKPPSFWLITTCLPCMAATCAGVGATPGGGGGMLAGACALNLAPASNWPVTGPEGAGGGKAP